MQHLWETLAGEWSSERCEEGVPIVSPGWGRREVLLLLRPLYLRGEGSSSLSPLI